MKVRPTNAAAGGILSAGGHQMPPQNPNHMLMSVIRYCGQSDTRLAGSILAEFSSGSLFLYCKESHQLIGQHCIEDLFWYVGVESVALVQAVEDGSKKGAGQQQANNNKGNSDSNLMVGNSGGGGDLNVPALTVVDRRLLTVGQGKERINFGQTLVFCSWSELYQWMRALMAAGEKIIVDGRLPRR